jgi:hypothetical protein
LLDSISAGEVSGGRIGALGGPLRASTPYPGSAETEESAAEVGRNVSKEARAKSGCKPQSKFGKADSYAGPEAVGSAAGIEEAWEDISPVDDIIDTEHHEVLHDGSHKVARPSKDVGSGLGREDSDSGEGQARFKTHTGRKQQVNRAAAHSQEKGAENCLRVTCESQHDRG